ncbi:MAG: DUF1499 domain-containing protein [Dokdonella sp.]
MKDPSSQITPCSGAPHCVSSLNKDDSARHVAPFAFDGAREQAHAALLKVLRGQKDARIEADAMPKLHATFRTTIGFVDDVTFFFRDDASLIDVKSKSRIGYYDFGVNRRRVESLRTEFSQAMAGIKSAE